MEATGDALLLAGLLIAADVAVAVVAVTAPVVASVAAATA